MRVGIHTGAVLAGVLGQRQWQFDVYSKDVEFANKMESSGMAGRVHISETTLSFLNDEFEVEPAYGERREEALRMAGIKTYFIVRTLKPFKDEVAEVRNGGGAGAAVADKEDEMSPLEEGSRVLGSGREREDSEDFKKRLRKEVMSRDGIRDLTNQTKFLSLSFVDSKKEHDYNHHKESFASIAILGCPIVYIMTTIAKCIVLPRYLVSEYFITIDLIVLVLLPVSSIAEFFPSAFPNPIVMCSKRTNNTLWKRRMLGIAIVLLLSVANIVDMVRCSIPFPQSVVPVNVTDEVMATIEPTVTTENCLFPSYFSVFGVLALIATALPAQLPHLAKVALLVIVAVAHCLVNVFVIAPGLDQEEEPNLRDWPNLLPGKYTLSGLLVIVTIALCILCRHTEQALRVLFLWRTEVEEQGERAADMRRRNEALVYNILPPHVAAHFMGSRTRQHEELYAQSYAEVGVLFASMPNFSDFYTEESVNNQGLECLRFLNEVISDFDALLELPQFADIIKIKTIGSTYMAASGLNPSMQVKPDDPIQVRWAHLSLLVEFAFELKKALQSINEQSFNHFVLKMGINHGPITAGVIGARKPHYDIWGNSVNVASRMESTGKAGCIQVTEETCNILQNFGYVFEQRGLVSVKGKGQLMTYYLVGKGFGGVVGGGSPTPGGVTPGRAQNGTAMNGTAPNGTAATGLSTPSPTPEKSRDSVRSNHEDEECDESAALLPRPKAPSQSANIERENDSETKRLLPGNEISKVAISNSVPAQLLVGQQSAMS